MKAPKTQEIHQNQNQNVPQTVSLLLTDPT